MTGCGSERYLLAWSHDYESVRIYALARIKSCAAGHDRFRRPPDFRPHDHIDPGFGVFVKEDPVGVAVRFDQPIASRICERTWHPNQRTETADDGAIVLRFTTNQQTQTLFSVSLWGPSAEILQPPQLRARAAEWFATTARRYRRKPE